MTIRKNVSDFKDQVKKDFKKDFRLSDENAKELSDQIKSEWGHTLLGIGFGLFIAVLVVFGLFCLLVSCLPQ